MLHLDITASLAKAISATMGIPDQELGALRTTMKRYIEAWLKRAMRGMPVSRDSSASAGS